MDEAAAQLAAAHDQLAAAQLAAAKLATLATTYSASVLRGHVSSWHMCCSSLILIAQRC